MPAIERWFRLEWMEHTPPFYSSVDIRNAGFKLAPVDTNLYPGGWNNLTQEMLPLARAVGDGRDREDLPGGQEPAGDSREPHPQHLLPEQPGPAQAHLPHGGAERSHRLDRPGDQGADQHRAAGRRHGDAGAGGAQQAPAGAEGFRPLHHPAEQRSVRRASPGSWKTSTSSTCCRRCTRAGRCGARAITSRATKKSPSASARCWASIPG